MNFAKELEEMDSATLATLQVGSEVEPTNIITLSGPEFSMIETENQQVPDSFWNYEFSPLNEW